MNTTLWIIQSLLALAFAGSGAMKLFAYEKYKVMLDKNGPTGLTRGLITFIGIAELAGGVGIVLPMAITSLRGSVCGLRLDSRAPCCWRFVFTCAVMNRPSQPSFFSYWQCS